MGRYTVCIEGRDTLDFRLFERGSLEPYEGRIAVTVSFRMDEIIGWAEDFHRNDETGAISFEIYFKAGWEKRVKDDQMTATCMVKDVKTTKPYDNSKSPRTIEDQMVITSGKVCEISFVDGPNAWGEYDDVS